LRIEPAQAATTCGESAGATLCLSAPSGRLSGEQTVSATWSGTGWAAVEFYLDGRYLNFEYQRPYSFVWPTHKDVDGTRTLSARVQTGAGFGAYVSTTVRLSNGNRGPSDIPRSPADYQSLFRPNPGNTFAAVGNGGAEKPDEKTLLASVEASSPTAFFYLGEVHEFGSWATRRDHYGLASFDDPSGVGTLYGRMARYTLATAGNHEHDYLTEFRDYWHQRPLWSTAVINGVRIYNLTSECRDEGGCHAGGAQATWLKAQLATNTEPCVLSLWHRPVVSMDSARSGPTMNPVWALLADRGGDLVVNADTRDMEELVPLNASLQVGQPNSHMVELISGAAAARWVTSPPNNDPRVAWRRYQVPGALYVTHETSPHALAWRFRDASGNVLRTGRVTC